MTEDSKWIDANAWDANDWPYAAATLDEDDEYLDIESAAYNGEWPQVFSYALEDLLSKGAPLELLNDVASALVPLSAWFHDTEPAREAQRKAQKLEEHERWLKEEEARLAPVRADEAAWAEHLKKLAETEGKADDRG